MSLKTSALAVTVSLLWVPSAWAHALHADYRVGKDKVVVEAFFDDDTPAAQALVKVLDPAKKVLAEGKTDLKGVWSFPVPPPGKYELIVQAGAGHRVAKPLVIPAGSSDQAAAPPNESETRAGIDPYRWLKAAIGLATIAALGIGYLLARRMSPRDSARASP